MTENETKIPVNRRKHIFTLVGLIIIIIDQLTKWRIEATMPLNTSIAPIPSWYPYFQFSRVNTGTLWYLPQC
ncbi:MAG: hypothetical protein H6667_01785 [Ardenticatenaceae bacterium]|nr:hypothetical protein [Ardenticatenaceae bacterium]